ncbi:MAG: hypothetical protein P9M15_07965 [Candidatus Electryoneaceae bacterium]|nr:hypothetical protein [Candidatus Electryoneaceae bacterium]
MKRKLSVVLLLLICAFATYAEDQWQILTDTRNVRDLLYFGGSVWCATRGGLVEFDRVEEQYTTFNPVDGLADVNINRLIDDGSGGFWMLFENRMMQRFEPGVGVTHTISRMARESGISRLRDVAVDTRGLFVATNRGIARMSYAAHIDRWVWLTDYTQLGTFPTEQHVEAVAVLDDELWAATAVGIAKGDLNSPDPLTWTNYTTADGLEGNDVDDIIVFDGRIIAVTGGGLSQWDGDGWSLFSDNRNVLRTYIYNDSLRAVVRGGVATWDGSDWVKVDRSWIESVVWDDENRLWVGLASNDVVGGGLALAVDDDWVDFPMNSPCTNVVDAFAFASDGDLLMVGGRSGGQYGLSRWNGFHWQIWTTPTYDEGIFSRSHRSVIADLDDGVWVGTFGGGIARYNPDETVDIYDYTPETGSRLQNSSSVPRWTITPAVTMDESGNVWVVNYDASDGNILVCIPRDFVQNPESDNDWYYFHRSYFNNYPYFELIAVDGRGRKWLASSATAPSPVQGVYVFDDNGTLDDPSDDRSYGPITGLNFGRVLSITWDPAGYIWVGSLDGAYYINADVSDPASQSFTWLYPLGRNQINCVAIDPNGNKWFGTTHGVTVLDPDLFTIRRDITTDYPDLLPMKTVRRVAIDPRTGWAYFGTDNGTAAMFTPYRDYGQSISSVSIEPNPFNPNRGRLYFTGSSLAGNASAKLFSPDGRLVRTLNSEEAALGWDGRNNDNHPVADGIYLIVTYNDNSQAAQGKVAVIWE